MVVVLDTTDTSYQAQVRNTLQFMNNPLIRSGTKVSDLVTDYLPLIN